MKNTEKFRNPNADLRCGKAKNLQVQIYCGGSPPFSGLVQGDAAAWDEDDGAHCGGGGARAVEGHERKKMMKRGRMKKDQSCLFIRERLISGREK